MIRNIELYLYALDKIFDKETQPIKTNPNTYRTARKLIFDLNKLLSMFIADPQMRYSQIKTILKILAESSLAKKPDKTEEA